MRPPEARPPSWKVAAAYACVYLAWGSTYLAIKLGVAHFSPGAMTGLRLLLAGSVLVAGRLLWGRPAPPSWRETANAALIGAVMLGGGQGLLSYAERSVASGVCALVVGSAPILFAALNRVAGGPRLTPYQIIGGVIGTTGVAVLALGGSASGDGIPSAGFALLLLSELCWVTASVASKYVKMPRDHALSAGLQMLFASLLLLAAGRLRGEFAFRALPLMPRQSALAILYLATVGSLAGFTAYSWLLLHEPANRVSSYAFVNPVVAVFLGAALGGEPVTLPIAASVVAVLSGVSLSLFGARLTKARLPETEPEA